MYEVKVSISENEISNYKFGKQYILCQSEKKYEETSIFIDENSDLSQECQEFIDVILDYLSSPFISFKNLGEVKNEINDKLDYKQRYILTKTRRNV